jgi:trimethylguanosine synthase
MEPYGTREIMERAFGLCQEVALYMPRTSDLKQLADYNELGEKLEIVHYCMGRKSKALTAYYGKLGGRVRTRREAEWRDNVVVDY